LVNDPATKITYKTEPGSVVDVHSENGYLPDNTIKDAYLSDKRIVLLLAPMGSGKTTQIKSLVSEYNPKTLIVSTRKAQASFFGGLFPNSEDYRKIEGSLFGVNKLVVCLNSLLRILDPETSEMPFYDLVVLDEIVSIVQVLSSPLLYKTNIVSIFQLLKCLIKYSKKIFLMDGLPNESIEDYLTIIDQWKECHVICHVKKPEIRTFVLYNEPSYFMKILDNNINDRNICISDSKMMTEYLNNTYCSKKKILMINGDSPAKTKKKIRDPDTNFVDYDMIIFNGAVGPGASFNIPNFFGSLFVVITGSGASPFDMYQLMCRIRKFKTDKVYILYVPNENNVYKDEFFLKHHTVDHYCNNIIEFDKLMNCKYDNLSVKVEEISEEHKKVIQLTGIGKKRTREEVFGLDDYTGLVNVDSRVVNALVQGPPRKRIKLVYEKTDFITFLVSMKLSNLKYCDNTVYIDTLKQLISKNGGVVIDKRIENNTKTIASFIRSVGKQIGIKPAFYFTFPEEYNENNVKQTEKILGNKFTDYDSHERFFMFLRENKYTDKERQWFEPLLKIDNQVLPGKSLNTTIIFTNAVKSFRLLLEILGMKLENGFIQGGFDTLFVIEHADKIHESMLGYYNERVKIDNYKFSYVLGSTKETCYRKKTVIDDVRDCFKWMGFKIEPKNKNALKRISMWGKTINVYNYVVSEAATCLRYAIKCKDWQTIQPKEDALLDFKKRFID
jgi:energy-coupling factor transporter ATP-binding protein EcfA2